MEPSAGNICGWASHVEGISRLFCLRGPERHVSGLSYRLILGFRATAVSVFKVVFSSTPVVMKQHNGSSHSPPQIIHALALRKPTYLAQSDWLTIPWTTQPKPDFHHLLDIMTQIPILIHQTEQIYKVSQSNTSIVKQSQLLEQGWKVHLQLKDWYQQLGTRYSEPLYIERPSSLSCPNPLPTDLEDVFPTFLDFQTFEIARIHLFYWTSLLLLYDNLLKTTIPSRDPNNLDSATSAIHPTILPTTDRAAIWGHAVDVAKLIARSMEFLLSEERFSLSEEMHIRGLLNTLFPLRTAIHVFSSVHQYKMEAWCRSVFDGLAQRGYPFGQMLCGWKWDEIPLFLSGRSPPQSVGP